MQNQMQNEGGFKTNMMTNPVIKKLGKVTEEAQGGKVATYGGIGVKTVFLLLLTVLGIGLFFIVHNYFAANSGAASTIDIPMGPENLEFYAKELPFLIIAGIFTIVTPLIAWAIRPAIPVFGSLYALSQGYLIAFMAFVYKGQYDMYVWLALAITIVIIFVMLFLYVKRIIKVTEKFNSVLKTLFFTTVLSGLGAFALSFVPIPALQNVMKSLQNNWIISLISSIAFIVIAALFLLSDFDAIEKTVENNLPKKYEWAAAYGLVFTVIWLYLKVLDLLIKVAGRSKSN